MDRAPKRNYFIECKDCEEMLAQADTIQKLLEILFQRLAEHNVIGEKICSEAKEELKMDNVRSSFASEMWQVYEVTKHEKRPIEWEKSGHGGLKNE